MKKIRFLEIHFQSIDNFFQKAIDSVETNTPYIKPRHHIFFDSISSLRSYLTQQKIQLLTVIANQRPSSIYELAKIVDRDFAGVQRECTNLAATGFIKLKKTKDPRKTLVPLLKFDYEGIIVWLPKSPYQIRFNVAA